MNPCTSKDELKVIDCNSGMEHSEMMFRLAGGVAHEVRNPLAILRVGLDNVAHNIPSKPERALEYMDDLYHCIDRIDEITRLLLECSASSPLRIQSFHPIQEQQPPYHPPNATSE